MYNLPSTARYDTNTPCVNLRNHKAQDDPGHFGFPYHQSTIAPPKKFKYLVPPLLLYANAGCRGTGTNV